MQDKVRCGENLGRKVQRVEESVEYGPWLQAGSPKRRFGQGSGGSKGAKQDYRRQGTSHNHSEGRRSSRESKQFDVEGSRRCSDWVQRKLGARA